MSDLLRGGVEQGDALGGESIGVVGGSGGPVAGLVDRHLQAGVDEAGAEEVLPLVPSALQTCIYV